jgi:hypothetical protein
MDGSTVIGLPFNGASLHQRIRATVERLLPGFGRRGNRRHASKGRLKIRLNLPQRRSPIG